MKKVIIPAIVLLFAFVAVAQAAKPTPAAENGLNKGKSESYQLYLYPKNPADWSIISDGAWGKMNINDHKFVFNGHALTEEVDYTLINFARVGFDWPARIFCLGSDVADENGNVHIKGEIEKLYADTTPDTGNPEAAKIWLVPSSDVTCGADGAAGSMNPWNPSQYLFEYGYLPLID